MTDVLHFGITFHGPFRVSTGSARDGLDVTVDHDLELPASSLKGVMRAAAERLLGRSPLIAEVFGAPGTTGSAWAWSDAALERTIRSRARVSINEESGTAEEGKLLTGEEVWAERGSFTVSRHGFLETQVRDRHALVLGAAGAAVHSLGGDRRRGLGWVTLRCEELPPDATFVARLRQAVPL